MAGIEYFRLIRHRRGDSAVNLGRLSDMDGRDAEVTLGNLPTFCVLLHQHISTRYLFASRIFHNLIYGQYNVSFCFILSELHFLVLMFTYTFIMAC